MLESHNLLIQEFYVLKKRRLDFLSLQCPVRKWVYYYYRVATTLSLSYWIEQKKSSRSVDMTCSLTRRDMTSIFFTFNHCHLAKWFCWQAGQCMEPQTPNPIDPFAVSVPNELHELIKYHFNSSRKSLCFSAENKPVYHRGPKSGLIKGAFSVPCKLGLLIRQSTNVI